MRVTIAAFVLSLAGACNLPYPAPATDAASTSDAPPGGSPDAPISPGTIQLTAAKGPFYVHAGVGSASVALSLARGVGVTGGAGITVTNPPSGVTFDALTIPDGSTTAQLTAHATGAAPFVTGTITIQAAIGSITSTDDSTLVVIGAPGASDTKFGTSGSVAYSPASTTPITLIAQGDKVVLVGKEDDAASVYGFRATRYSSDGSIDLPFGDGTGTVSYNFGTNGIKGGIRLDAAAQSDGKIVIGGSGSNGTDFDPVIARLTIDGQIDNTLGPRRVDTTSDDDVMSSLGIGTVHPAGMPDSIYLGGTQSAAPADPRLMHLDATGGLDAAIGRPSQGGPNQTYVSVVVQNDGRIVTLANGVAGLMTFHAYRFGTDGTDDTSFNVAFMSKYGKSFPTGCSLPTSAGFLCWGTDTDTNNDPVLAVWALTVDGAPVSTFGNVGVPGAYESPLGSKMNARMLVALPDGSGYVVVGLESAAPGRMTVAGVNPDGTPNALFGANGIVYSVMGFTPIAAVALADHRLVIVGGGPGNYSIRSLFW